MRRGRLWWSSRRLRLRLTILFGGLFFAAGSILLWFTYLFTAQAMNQQFVGSSLVKALPPDAAPRPGAAVPDVLFQGEVEQRADSVLGDMVRSSTLVLVLVGAVALVLGYVLADRALRPLDRVTDTAQRLSESTLHERIGLRGPPDEVRRLADTFDAMLDRLHRVFDAQRRFIANASHELRTPLAVNRTVLEVSLEEPAASPDLKALARALLGTNARYERLIEGLLLLAQSEQELTVRKPVDLEQVVRTVLEQIDLQSRKRPITLHQDLRPALVEGDPLFLERCVFNLLENAIKHNVRDGEVWLTLGGERGGAVITVRNTGPLVPPYEVDDLFEPFSRSQGDRVRSFKGAGLGLSIVRAIVHAHGGQVSAVAPAQGGLQVTVRLPYGPR
ncbi:sensor histidine kinase [Nonomuraea zeae]|uniref:histidine kinase n=2 Tax=Nonomuraea zeae TaxID=1642303 RepID=A0A5S4FEB9_9ACTN|nr:HAMP domain-containing sensor histidine kinase [Nonomuraea zeae]TMR16682.1 HAMP domain-containing histidine kinase [Nonomuraea zeae]